MKSFSRLLSFAAVFLVTVAMTSCVAHKNIVYFQNNEKNDSAVEKMDIANRYEPVIQSTDILAINITSISSITIDKDPVNVFKQGGTQYTITATQGGQNSNMGQNVGYLVDQEGFIDFPVLGKIKMAGLNMRQAKDALSLRLKDYVKDPVVEVRIINYKVVVLGEVNRPGTVIAPNHTISIIEALAAAGDIPVTGKKSNVLIVRENGGKREFARLDLGSKDVFNSPYYYLHQNDIVYVEPSKVRRQETSEFFRVYLPSFTAILSTILAIYGIVQISK